MGQIATRLRRTAASAALATPMIAGLLLSGAPAHAVPARPAAQPVFQIVNSPGTTDRSPSATDPSSTTIANGTNVTLVCYYYGAPAGQYGNTLWYMAAFNGTAGWINDHNLNTPGTAANPQPQSSHCQTGFSARTSGFSTANNPGTWSNSPSLSDNSGVGLGNGQPVYLQCYYYGAAAGQYGNTLWYLAETSTNGPARWINDHNLNTPGTAANPQPQTPHC
ncbi:hypothetical protein [Streptomyces sp. NPDC126522]|uniref:hypothetical protein n=1 Tax=Streptomyces sp. NPDC126522 TaxID=3155211 RepID=UPI0033252E5B